ALRLLRVACAGLLQAGGVERGAAADRLGGEPGRGGRGERGALLLLQRLLGRPGGGRLRRRPAAGRHAEGHRRQHPRHRPVRGLPGAGNGGAGHERHRGGLPAGRGRVGRGGPFHRSLVQGRAAAHRREPGGAGVRNLPARPRRAAHHRARPGGGHAHPRRLHPRSREMLRGHAEARPGRPHARPRLVRPHHRPLRGEARHRRGVGSAEAGGGV
ncbi:MAG: Nitrilotriacetate monooxygenase component B, partial [uncultured Acetobacteraceae bacterium]